MACSQEVLQPSSLTGYQCSSWMQQWNSCPAWLLFQWIPYLPWWAPVPFAQLQLSSTGPSIFPAHFHCQSFHAACSAKHHQCHQTGVGLMDGSAAFIPQRSTQRAGRDMGREELALHTVQQNKWNTEFCRRWRSENQGLGENLLRRQHVHFGS